jgi:hypothetical protein
VEAVVWRIATSAGRKDFSQTRHKKKWVAGFATHFFLAAL